MDRRSDRGRGTVAADLGHRLGAVRPERIVDLDELGAEVVGQVRDHRHLVVQHIVVVNSAGVRINHEHFEQSSADAHGHAAVYLAFSG